MHRLPEDHRGRSSFLEQPQQGDGCAAQRHDSKNTAPPDLGTSHFTEEQKYPEQRASVKHGLQRACAVNRAGEPFESRRYLHKSMGGGIMPEMRIPSHEAAEDHEERCAKKRNP